ncbi:hypothetical protein SVAN01_00179 [Stagonosporopsis vannaccii]|nr:hypothetical protein SVAN01_00179 [Stagonosporopsis vannaccii]
MRSPTMFAGPCRVRALGPDAAQRTLAAQSPTSTTGGANVKQSTVNGDIWSPPLADPGLRASRERAAATLADVSHAAPTLPFLPSLWRVQRAATQQRAIEPREHRALGAASPATASPEHSCAA